MEVDVVAAWLVGAAFGQEARIEGSTLTLAFGGAEYALSNSKAYAKPLELHFEQPYDQGYNQLWIVVGKAKKGVPTPIDGYGMSAAFVQIQPDASSESSTRNVSASCATNGTVTMDGKAKPGGTVTGSVDVTITCSDVPELPAPVVVRGSFSLPVAE